MPTYPLDRLGKVVDMFVRCKKRKKNGKWHAYYSVVENRRSGAGQVSQRQLLHLGELNAGQEDRWRKSVAVFDERRRATEEMRLFTEEQAITPKEADTRHLRVSAMQLRRCRHYGVMSSRKRSNNRSCGSWGWHYRHSRRRSCAAAPTER